MPDSKKERFYFAGLSGLDKLREEVVVTYVETFQKGYSVIELTRISGTRSARYVHSVLVAHGKIPKTRPGREKSGITPKELLPSLKARGLTFSLWCAGWYFDPQVASREIIEKNGQAFDAVKRDFPTYYERVTKTKKNIIEYLEQAPEAAEPDRFIVEYEPAKGCFKTFTDPDGVKGYGKNPVESLKMFLRCSKSLATIKKLNELPNILGW